MEVNVYGTGGQSFSNLASCCNAASDKTGLCDEFNCPVGGGGGGGGGKSCTLGKEDCGDSQYCSIASKKCSDPPSTWTSDFYNSAIQAMTSGGAQPDVAKCMVNGIAASSGCNVTPSQFNTSTTETCVDNTVVPNCKKDLGLSKFSREKL